jgi:hypothetical protein
MKPDLTHIITNAKASPLDGSQILDAHPELAKEMDGKQGHLVLTLNPADLRYISNFYPGYDGLEEYLVHREGDRIRELRIGREQGFVYDYFPEFPGSRSFCGYVSWMTPTQDRDAAMESYQQFGKVLAGDPKFLGGFMAPHNRVEAVFDTTGHPLVQVLLSQKYSVTTKEILVKGGWTMDRPPQ